MYSPAYGRIMKTQNIEQLLTETFPSYKSNGVLCSSNAYCVAITYIQVAELRLYKTNKPTESYAIS